MTADGIGTEALLPHFVATTFITRSWSADVA
jgi:hypothetical protein